MPKIFVSYRRGGVKARTYRMGDELRRQFGDDNVFVDIDSIDPGTKFADAIRSYIRSSDFVLIMIGPKWVEMTCGEGKRRLHDPKDHLRIEVETALRSKAIVIPVLVNGAQMPHPTDLPNEIAELTQIQAYTLTDSHWQYDVEQLVRKIDPTAGKKQPETAPQPAPRPAAPPASAEKLSASAITSIVLTVLVFLSLLGDLDYEVLLGIFGMSVVAMLFGFWAFFKAKPKRLRNKAIVIGVTIVAGLMAWSALEEMAYYMDDPYAMQELYKY